MKYKFFHLHGTSPIVAPFVGAGIEILKILVDSSNLYVVAPFVGAGIEMQVLPPRQRYA